MTTMASQIAQPFVEAQIKENIKAPHHWPLWGESTGDRWIISQRASNAENISIWWPHHAMASFSPQVVRDLTSYDKIPTQAYQAMVLVLLIPLIFIRNLRALAPLSVIANILTALGIFVIYYYCVQDLRPTTDFPSFAGWATLPMFFGTAIYTFEGIGVVSFVFFIHFLFQLVW